MLNPIRDLRITARNLAHKPSYSLLVVAMLTLGIAGNSAIFSLVHSLLLAPLAFEEAEQLVYLDETAPQWNLELVSIAYADFHTWRENNRTFDSMALVRNSSWNAVIDGDVERLEGSEVTWDLTRVLRIEPLLGRSFLPEEDRPGGERVAILSHGLWQGRFAGDPEILGRTMKLNGEMHTVVGVLPPAVRYPADSQLWVPASRDAETDYGSYQFEGVGRLRPGVTPARAKEDLDATMQTLKETYAFKEATSSVVKPLREHFVADSSQIAWVLMAAVALVLFVACVNVANLMLARSSARLRELGIRMALGASQGRIVAQLLGEALLLASVGGAFGLILGRLGLLALGSMVADELPFWVSFEANSRALGISFAACVATALVFGLVPAFQSVRRVDLQSTLRTSVAGAGASRSQQRTLSGLVVAEMALAQMLLVGAALVMLSERQVLQVEPGFRTDNVLAFALFLPESTYPDDAGRYTFFDQLVTRLDALPGVYSAAAITNPPLMGHNGMFFEAEGVERQDDEPTPVVLTRWASESYLETLGVSLLRGRPQRVTGVDEAVSYEVVVNESFAHQFWGDEDPLGKRVRTDEEAPWLTVVGLARDVRHYGLDKDPRPGVYLPMGYQMYPFMAFTLHTAVDPLSMVASARQVVSEMDPELPLFRVTTMGQALHRSLTLRRLTAWLFGLFAAIALVLAAGGTYGVISYGVSERRWEFGVRMALGARGGQVVAQVLRRGMALVTTGAVFGLLGAAALGKGLAALLFRVEARDPAVFVGVALALLSVALLANVVPALKASRIDPMRVLREE